MVVTLCYHTNMVRFYLGMFTKSIGDGEWEGKLINVGLCSGRHDIAGVTDFIFTEPIENPNDFKALRKIASEKLDLMWNEGNCINLYVTGLSQALTIVLSEALKLHESTKCDILFQVFHWDRESETYKGHTFVGS